MILDKYFAIKPDAYNAHKFVDDVERCINSGMTTGNCVYWEEWVGDYTLDIYSGEIVMSPYNCRNNNIEVISLTKWLSKYEKLKKNLNDLYYDTVEYLLEKVQNKELIATDITNIIRLLKETGTIINDKTSEDSLEYIELPFIEDE